MKIIRGLILFLIFLLAATPTVAAQNSSYAEALNHLELFSGTGKGNELSRVPTRAEALVMMLRLWGKEDEIQKKHIKIHFMIRDNGI